MDTSPHIGGAADSQKDRGVRQRKSLVFLNCNPLYQPTRIDEGTCYTIFLDSCAFWIRRLYGGTNSQMSYFWYISQVPGVSGRHTTRCRFLSAGGASDSTGGRDQSILLFLTCRYIGQDPSLQPITGLSQRSQHSAV